MPAEIFKLRIASSLSYFFLFVLLELKWKEMESSGGACCYNSVFGTVGAIVWLWFEFFVIL